MSYQFWVTTKTLGLDTPDRQMRFLNDVSTSDPEWEFVSVDPQGHYIFRSPSRSQSSLTGCMRCDTGMNYYMHEHDIPPNPGTSYL